jgi:hypothetical protein
MMDRQEDSRVTAGRIPQRTGPEAGLMSTRFDPLIRPAIAGCRREVF